MIPHLSKKDLKLFNKYIKNCNIYFEFGSGGSTYEASIQKNIKKIYSVESDKIWHNKLKEKITHNNIIYLYNEMKTLPNNWGQPGKDATNEQKINYSNKIVNLDKNEKDKIDFIFIDGRFRVACCLKSYNNSNENCIIAFDDFLNRKQYHIVLNYFDIIERTEDNRMVILKKKKNIKIDENIIKKYELIAD